LPIPERYRDRKRENREIEENVDVFLELLDEAGARATFFFLGRIAEDLPHVVWRVAEQGHEIASHNYHHRRITGLRPSEFREMVMRSKKALEDASSSPVLGFRAPDFSITKQSLWALDELHETVRLQHLPHPRP
jgi:peptidoglycan/xylan/chitin deacetylase (PgdA/CDA1 family)